MKFIKPELFPFKSNVGVQIYSLILYISTRYKLPLFARNFALSDNLKSFSIFDSDNVYIGTFSNSRPNLYPKNVECFGKIVWGDSFSPSDLSSELEYSCIKLCYPYKLPYLTINESYLTGDVVFSCTSGGSVTSTPSLHIVANPLYGPKCKSPLPITSINNVTPNSDGLIKLTVNHPLLSLSNLDLSRMMLSCSLTNADFDRHAITAGTGPIGPQGIPGRDGIDGINAPIAEPDPNKRFYGGKFDGYSFTTVNIDASWVCDSKLYSPNKLYYVQVDNSLASNQWKQFNIPKYPTAVSTFGYGTSDGYINTTKVSDYPIISIIDSNIFLDTQSLHVNNSVYPNEGYNNLRMINNQLFVLSNTGYKIWGKFEVKLGHPCYDTDGTWLVGALGTLYYLNGYSTPSSYTHAINYPHDLKFITTAFNITAVVGNTGAFFFFKNNRWYRVRTPIVKNWSSVFIQSPNLIWLW